MRAAGRPSSAVPGSSGQGVAGRSLGARRVYAARSALLGLAKVFAPSSVHRAACAPVGSASGAPRHRPRDRLPFRARTAWMWTAAIAGGDAASTRAEGRPASSGDATSADLAYGLDAEVVGDPAADRESENVASRSTRPPMYVTALGRAPGERRGWPASARSRAPADVAAVDGDPRSREPADGRHAGRPSPRHRTTHRPPGAGPASSSRTTCCWRARRETGRLDGYSRSGRAGQGAREVRGRRNLGRPSPVREAQRVSSWPRTHGPAASPRRTRHPDGLCHNRGGRRRAVVRRPDAGTPTTPRPLRTRR